MTARKYTGKGALRGKEFVTDARCNKELPDGVIGARLPDAEIGEVFASEVRREGFTVKSVTCFAGNAEVETGVIREPQKVLDAIDTRAGRVGAAYAWARTEQKLMSGRLVAERRGDRAALDWYGRQLAPETAATLTRLAYP